MFRAFSRGLGRSFSTGPQHMGPPPPSVKLLSQDLFKNAVLLSLGCVSGLALASVYQTDKSGNIEGKIKKLGAPGAILRVAFTGGEGPERSQLVQCISAQLRLQGLDVFAVPSVESVVHGFTNGSLEPDYWGEDELERLLVYQNSQIRIQNANECSAAEMPAPSQQPTVVLYDGCVLDASVKLPLEEMKTTWYYNGLQIDSLRERYDLVFRFDDKGNLTPKQREAKILMEDLMWGEHQNQKRLGQDFSSTGPLDIIRKQMARRQAAISERYDAQ